MAIPTILSGAAGSALKTLKPLQAMADDVAGSRALINSAKPDITKALGATRQPAFSAELHASSRNFASGVAGPEGIHAAMAELSTAASATAVKRVTIGSLAIGGALAGLLALRSAANGSDGQIMAPGPIGGDRSADTGVINT
jgi:hypothetical protein